MEIGILATSIGAMQYACLDVAGIAGISTVVVSSSTWEVLGVHRTSEAGMPCSICCRGILVVSAGSNTWLEKTLESISYKSVFSETH